jgi:hypothetical protein
VEGSDREGKRALVFVDVLHGVASRCVALYYGFYELRHV